MPEPAARPRPRLVVFDLGGVLVRICRTWQEACGAAGVPYREVAETVAARSARQRWVVEHEIGRVALDDFCAHLASALGGAYTPAEVRRIHEAWTLAEFDGVPALLDHLARAAVDTAILSNTNAAHWRRLAPERPAAPEYPSLLRIRHRFASHLLGLRKPDPEVFAHVESATGHGGADVLFFDDLADNVAAARAAGWRAALVDPAADPVAQMRAALVREGLPAL